MRATLERNTGADTEQVPYTIVIEVVTWTIDAGTSFRIPVYVTYGRTGKRYHVEACGYRRESENPYDLPGMVGKLLRQLTVAARFPSYVFIAREGGELFPVYTIENEVFATTAGGPVFRHVELAKVREYLTDYLNAIGILGTEEKADKLHVRGVDPVSFALLRPVFYLKKRVPGQVEFWAPVFEARDGQSIYTYAASARREASCAGGQEVLALRDIVADALHKDKRLPDELDLRPDRLKTELWARLQPTLSGEGDAVAGGLELDLYQADTLWLAAEKRPDEARVGLFLGTSREDVLARAERDCMRRGIGDYVSTPVPVL